MLSRNLVDIKENDIINYDEELLLILLKDHSSNKNIIWATDNYMNYGDEYKGNKEIKEHLISGDRGNIIQPRSKRTENEQQIRVKDKAEVFTPSWLCNKQNNIIDNAWFCSEAMFNIETNKGWISQSNRIIFPTKNKKKWKDYVQDVRMEISCGEAPYLVSRYDTITGKFISISDRIGLLDRKLRVVSENNTTISEWYHWSKIAFQSTYGYEWQGDNLLLARENLLFTFIDYYKDQFNKTPDVIKMREIATIISWNTWQMDGLKGVIPNSCSDKENVTKNLFEEDEITIQPCEGCLKNDIHKHNGIYCIIKDWKKEKVIKFVSLLK